MNDYTNFSGDIFAKTIPINVKNILAQNNPDLRLLLNITNTIVNKDIVEAFKKAGVDVKPVVNKTAVVGITGIQMLLLKFVNKFSNIGATPFDTLEEAKDWLVED